MGLQNQNIHTKNVTATSPPPLQFCIQLQTNYLVSTLEKTALKSNISIIESDKDHELTKV